MRRFTLSKLLLVGALSVMMALTVVDARVEAKKEQAKTEETKKSDNPMGQGFTYAANHKALSDKVKKGLAFLIKTQNQDGGWRQGNESRAMGGSGIYIDE